MDALNALNYAAPVAEIYHEVEERLLCHIAEQLSANPDTLINATSEWRIKMLAQMGRLNRDTARIIAERVGKVPDEVERVVRSSIDGVLSEYGLAESAEIEESIATALKNYDRQAVRDKYNQVNTVMQYKARQAYVNGVNGAADRVERLKQKPLGNAGEYLNILNENAMAVTLGERSRTEALRETITEMNRKGIPAFVDKTGREWSPEAYVNMDIRNTAKNAALAAEFASLDELGQDVILVTSHSGARPLCAPYQGKLYSRSGKSGTITDARGKVYSYSPLSETSFGEAAGLFGINCGHRMRGVSDGAFINREKEYDEAETSEEYKAVQKQREIERKIRKDRTEAKMLEAVGDSEGAKAAKRRAAANDRALREYCEREGLNYRKDRTEVYGYRAGVDKARESGIIELKEEIDSEGENGILKLSSKFVNPNDQLFTNADKIKPLEGFSDIVCHGAPNELLINGLEGEEWSYNAKEAAEMIRNSNEFSGKPIRLLSCSTGSGKNCIAQKISDELGVEVLAPTEDIYVNAEGDMFLTNNKSLAYMWNEGETVKETGSWVLFTPKKG